VCVCECVSVCACVVWLVSVCELHRKKLVFMRFGYW